MDSIEFLYFHVQLNEILTAEEMQTKKDAELKELQDGELSARTVYLEANYPDAVPSESGLYYIRTKKGSGSKPKVGQTVTVHYTGTLIDGTKFDSSVDRGQPFDFPLGQGRVIKGWDEGLGMMQKGEKGILVIPSDLGYGSRGSGKIAPFSTLIFEVEMIDFKDTASN
jgi:peptidylprolyl isomerase